MGESVDILVTCEDDGTTQVPVTVFIDEIHMKHDPEHTDTIVLDDELEDEDEVSVSGSVH